MKRLLCLALVLSCAVVAAAAKGDVIDVMTQNQYLGADLGPIIAAQTPAEFNQEVLEALAQIARNDVRVRAQLLAAVIVDRGPHLVGLQEVFAFECLDLATQTGPGCDDPVYSGAFNDHLALTLEAVSALAEARPAAFSYAAVASVQDLSIPIPADTDFDGALDILVTVVDRDVILARADVVTAVVPVPFSSYCARPSLDGGPGCNYQVVAEASTVFGPIAQERGWVGVDATVAGKDYRFVNTHLEVRYPDASNPLSPFIQAAQAAELRAILVATTPPERSLIVVGDLNSSPEHTTIPGPLPLPPPFDTGIDPPYLQLFLTGFIDAWKLRSGTVPGYSCCQETALSNHKDLSDERIDTIWSSERPQRVKKARVLGTKVSSKSGPFGLWASDHGTVAATLQFE